jgi:SNF2 family DNA or RNA helicase
MASWLTSSPDSSFILPQIFNDLNAWNQTFNFSSLTAEDGGALSKMEEFSLLVAQLHLIINPLMLRRLKRDVETDLPLKKEYVRFTGFRVCASLTTFTSLDTSCERR